MSNIQFSHVVHDGNDFLSAFLPGGEFCGPADSSHPNFKRIVALAAAKVQGEDVSVEDVRDAFDVPAAVQRAFQRLSDRITVEGDTVKLDGDPIDNTLTEQILALLNEGEDFAPLVNFYEKLLTNPLGDVREGLFDWIKGQTSDGSKVTITPDGNLIGYKGVWPAGQGHGGDGSKGGYVPSRAGMGIVNGVEVNPIQQDVGDTVEMPRSTLSEPSMECGVGLHVGTWNYAKRFGPVCMIVEFNPRDVVSAPDANSSWKLRVCRYKVVEIAGEFPVDTSVYRCAADVDFDTDDVDGLDPDFDLI